MNKKLRTKSLITPENKPNLIYLALTLQAVESLVEEGLAELSRITKELKEYLSSEDK